MKMTRRNFLSTSAVAAFACGASLTAHAAGKPPFMNFARRFCGRTPSACRAGALRPCAHKKWQPSLRLPYPK